MAAKKQPRRSADSYGSPSNSSTIKTKSSTIKNLNKPTSRELASLKKTYAKTPTGMARPPRTGPGSGGGARSLYNRLTGGGLNKHGR